MAKKTDYKLALNQLGDKLASEPVSLPIQEVRPVEPASAGAAPTEKINTAKKDSHINFWVPEELMERLKIHAARSKKTIKQIGIEALEQFLSE